MKRWLVVLVLGACGGEAAAPDAAEIDAREIDAREVDAAVPDAEPGADLSCLGLPPRATASDPLAVGGTVFAVHELEVAQLAGASVTIRKRGDDAVLASATTDDEGRFDATIASGGAVVDAYLVVAAAGYLATRAEPVTPLAGGEDVLLIVADSAEVGAWYATAGDAYESGMRTVITAVADCARDAVRGATVAIAPAPATITYYDDVAQAWDPRLAASSNGFALATDAAAEVTITAQSGADSFPPATIAPQPDTVTLAVVQPFGR
jgi:hypothetical protein